MNTTDRELRDWQKTWQEDVDSPVAPEIITRTVKRRGREIAIWIAGEIVVAVAALTFLLYRVATQPDLGERVAMGLLALIAVAALLFEWWNWRGVIRSSASTTSRYLALAIERSHRLRRSVRAAWVILGAEIAVFVPWVWNRLYGDGEPPTAFAERFGWGWLAGLTLAAVIGILLLQRRIDRDAHALESLARETEAEAE